MSLQGKVVAIFAAAGAIASVTSRELARRGAIVYISGRKRAPLEALASAIREDAGQVHTAIVDAHDDEQVGAWLDEIIAAQGRLDVVFNGIGLPPQELKYPARSVEQPLDDFLTPINYIVGAQFLTARHGARRMTQGGSIILLSATLGIMTARNMAGLSSACGAIESLTRALAGDFGPHGVRVNCVRANAMPETSTIQETMAGLIALGDAPQMSPPPLGRPILISECASVVAFLASADASGMTGQVVTVSAGAFVG